MIIVKISSSSIEVGGSNEDNFTLALSYLETVKAKAEELGISISSEEIKPGQSSTVSIPPIKGPWEQRYLAATGKLFMKVAKSKGETGTIEEIAQKRCLEMGITLDAEVDSAIASPVPIETEETEEIPQY